jgi:cytochrome b6-f complex iron-sulfur subunit
LEEDRAKMKRLSMWPVVLGLALAMILVTVIKPVENSLAYASALVVILSLVGWVLEAREVAGPPPAVEPEHEEEEEAPGPSYWPLVLALGVVGIAAGLVYEWEYGALIAAIPLAAGAGAAWASVLQREMAAGIDVQTAGPPLVTSSGRVLLPVPGNVLAAQAAGGAAIAIEQVETKQVSRRNLLRITFWTGLLGGLLAFAGTLVDMLYPRGIVGFGGVIQAGTIDQYPVGSKTQNFQGKFWLVHLSEEQGGPGFLALWWKCPHLGCTVPFREGHTFPDPATGQNVRGWFLCPCHGSTYNDAGVRVFGPAPRSMDRMALTIDPASGRISVDTGDITSGTPDNANFAVQA